MLDKKTQLIFDTFSVLFNGKYRNGKIPMQTFREKLSMAREKLVGYNQTDEAAC